MPWKILGMLCKLIITDCTFELYMWGHNETIPKFTISNKMLMKILLNMAPGTGLFVTESHF